MVSTSGSSRTHRWAATVRSGGRPLDLTIEVTGYDRPWRPASTTHMSTAEVRGDLTFRDHPVGTRMEWHRELGPNGVFRLLGQ